MSKSSAAQRHLLTQRIVKTTAALLVVTTMACFAPRAQAQVSNLDMTTLIEGMRAEGMNELLMHLAETEDFQDPILKQQVIINQHLLAQDRFNELANLEADPREAIALRQRGAEQFQQALEARRKLIADYPDNEQRPIWQTQLAMQLLGEYLEGMNQNAGQFYEYGVPTVKQRQAYEEAVVEALVQLENADVTFFELSTRLAQQADHVAKRVNTGLWDRMMEQFYNLRTQYALAQARYDVWLLPDDHPYFQNLGGRFARQRDTIAAERQRLLTQGLEISQRLLDTRAQANDILDGTRLLVGQYQIALNQTQPGLAMLGQIMQTSQPTLVDLEARLRNAYALHATKQRSQAMSQLDQLSSHGLVASNLLMRLLVTDARHRLLLDEASSAPAAQKATATAAAYEPYLRLMEDDSLGSSAAAIRNYIQQRWASSIDASTDMDQVPAVVAASMAQMLRSEGQNLINQSVQARRDGDESREAQLQSEAMPKLQRAQTIAQGLLDRSNLTPAVRANAMYEKALAIYFANRTNIARLIEGATILIDLADQFPDQSRASDALTSAMGGILYPLFSQQISEAGPAYERAMKVMLEKFPSLPATHQQRYFYATTVLLPRGDQQMVIDVLQPVPTDHPDFFLSRQQIIRSKLAQVMAAPAEDRIRMANEVLEQVNNIQGELAASATSASGEQAQLLEAVSGAIVIMKADLLTLAGQVPQAISILSDFEEQFTRFDDLVREALGKRILLKAGAGDLDAVRNEAAQMMASFPDEAAPVIDEVLTGLDNQIDQLRQRKVDELVQARIDAIDKQITDTSAASQQLARMLVDWALARNFTEDEMLPFQLILAKSMRLAGNAKEAVAYLEPIYAKYQNDLDVLTQTGEAYYASGTNEHLIEAAAIFNTIIGGVPPENNVYPAVWWNAWMRRMQIMDKMNEMTRDIPLRVRQLEITDPQLGGEPYRSELKRLALKHGG